MMRIGLGWDRHRLEAGRPCMLGGLHFADNPLGPVGHSDGDAVCHAVIDALLGAAGLGDIGTHFPDTDPRWAGADSVDLLARTWGLVAGAGFRLCNIDLTIITESPMIGPRRDEMRARLAAVLEVGVDQVSVKATRGEGLGPEGRQECLTVQAIALLET